MSVFQVQRKSSSSSSLGNSNIFVVPIHKDARRFVCPYTCRRHRCRVQRSPKADSQARLHSPFVFIDMACASLCITNVCAFQYTPLSNFLCRALVATHSIKSPRFLAQQASRHPSQCYRQVSNATDHASLTPRVFWTIVFMGRYNRVAALLPV